MRQWHLDLAMLGTAKVACGLAVDDPPRLAAGALRIGGWTNAMAFLPLAFNPELEDHPAFAADGWKYQVEPNDGHVLTYSEADKVTFYLGCGRGFAAGASVQTAVRNFKVFSWFDFACWTT